MFCEGVMWWERLNELWFIHNSVIALSLKRHTVKIDHYPNQRLPHLRNSNPCRYIRTLKKVAFSLQYTDFPYGQVAHILCTKLIELSMVRIINLWEVPLSLHLYEFSLFVWLPFSIITWKAGRFAGFTTIKQVH